MAFKIYNTIILFEVCSTNRQRWREKIKLYQRNERNLSTGDT